MFINRYIHKYKMGSSESLDKTILANSLIGKKFKTKVPFIWYCYNNSDFEWRITVANPDNKTLGIVNMTIKEPIEFTVINVVKYWHSTTTKSYSDGYSFDIVIRVDKLIPLCNISFNIGQDYILETPNTKTGMKFSKKELQIDTSAIAHIYPFCPPTGFCLTLNSDRTCNVDAPVIIDTNVLEDISPSLSSKQSLLPLLA